MFSILKLSLALITIGVSVVLGGKYGLIPLVRAEECPQQECEVRIPNGPQYCLNEEEQSVPIPDGQTVDGNGFCINIDVCPNLDGNQATVPENYYQNQKTGDCEQLPESDPQVLGASTVVLPANK